jgi:hypothetical protein
LIPQGLAACLGLIGLVPAGEAAAQQGPAVVCEVADFNIALRLYLPLQRDGSGAPAPGGLQGTLEIFHQKVAKESRSWLLDGRQPSQFWNVDSELKMQLLFGSGEDRIRLLIDARRREDVGQHVGTFRLEAGSVRVVGRLACTAG